MTSTDTLRSTLFIMYPEFSTEDTDKINRINLFIERNKKQINSKVWGELTDDGIITKTCFELALTPGVSTSDSVSGAIKRQKDGDMEREYVSSNFSKKEVSYYSQNNYGIQFMVLYDSVPSYPLIVNK